LEIYTAYLTTNSKKYITDPKYSAFLINIFKVQKYKKILAKKNREEKRERERCLNKTCNDNVLENIFVARSQ
jgi:hypothetical protein